MTSYKSTHASGRLFDGKGIHTVKTSLFIFQDQGVWFYYSPALDLSGYGASEIEAQHSFSNALEELLKYTTNKGTLKQMLIDLGWVYTKLSKKSKKLMAPSLHDLISRDDYLKEVFEKKEFKKVNTDVNLPELA